MKPHILNFRSLAECVAHSNKYADKYHGTSYGKTESDWTDDYSFEGFLEDFYSLTNKNRDEKTLNKITAILEKKIEKYKSHFIPQNTFREHHEVGGSVVDIGRYLEQEPECMINFGEAAQKKAINIVFQLGGNGRECSTIKAINSIAYCLNNILKNRAVNLFGCINNSDKLFIFMPFVLSSSDVITPQVELALLNPRAFFRRIIFGIFESAPDKLRDDIGITPKGGYGQSRPLCSDEITKFFGIKADIIIDSTFIDGASNIEEICDNLIKRIINCKN